MLSLGNRLEKPDAAEAKLLLRHTQYSIFCFLSVTPVGSLRIRKFCTVGYLKMFEAWLGRTFDPVYDYTIDHDYTNMLIYYIMIYYCCILYTVVCGYYTIWDFLCEGAMEDHRIIYHFLHSSSPSKVSFTWSCGSYTSEAWFWFKIWRYSQERNGVTSFKWIAIQDWLVLHSCGYSITSRQVRSKLKQV